MPIADDIADRLLDRSVDLARLEAGERRKVLAILADMETAIVKALRQTDPTAPKLTRFRKQRLETLLGEVREITRGAYRQIAREEQRVIAGVASAEAPAVATAVNTAAESRLLTAGLGQARIQAIADELLVLGAPLQETWGRQAATTVLRFQDMMRRGLLVGDDLSTMIRNTRQIIQGRQRDAETLVRTSLQSVQNATRLSVFEANADAADITQWVSAHDPRTCILCQAVSGLTWDTETKKPIGHKKRWPGPPPLHPNCVSEDSFITPIGRVAAYFKRRFEGDILTIRTAAGHQLTVTKNHPILTRHGWIAAYLLQIGDEILRGSIGERVAGSTTHDQNMPMSIKDVVHASHMTSNMRSIPVEVAPEDFHGDGFHGKVDIITAKSFLRNIRYLQSVQHLSEAGFQTRLMMAIAFLLKRKSCFHPFFFSDISHACRYMRRLCLPLSLIISHLAPFQQFSLTPPTWDNTTTLQTAGDQRSNSIELLCNIVDRGALHITSDYIVSINVRAFSTHVYNLQTESGAYICNGIITQNCRCTLIAVPTAFGPAEDVSFETWLQRKPAQTQRQILGKGRYELWKAGRIRLTQLTDQSHRPLTLQQLRSA